MRKSYIAITFIMFLFFEMIPMMIPGVACAEYEPAGHRWTIGFENGVTLRRFLGKNWEVYLGGGPDDFKSEAESTSYRYPGDDSPELYSFYEETHKTESGFVHLGVGRQLIRENRFWLTAIVDFSYNWENHQTSNKRKYIWSDDIRVGETVGHRMVSTFSLGLRPAYDITSRIVVTAEFGFYFRTTTRTTDYRDDSFDGSQWTVNTERYANNSDSAGVYGIDRIYSLGLMFRF